MPIFPGGGNFADRAIYGLFLDKAREDFAKKQKELYYDIKSAYEGFKNAVEVYQVQKNYLNSSVERAKIAAAKYLNGLITYDEWDRLQTQYISDQTGLLSSQRAVLAAEADWLKSYGGRVK
ncbi:TolC family protein [Candidatus Saganbacteria bacterium]|nr:TolC family protein [Candidatus Saganbacteria bacterium]